MMDETEAFKHLKKNKCTTCSKELTSQESIDSCVQTVNDMQVEIDEPTFIDIEVFCPGCQPKVNS